MILGRNIVCLFEIRIGRFNVQLCIRLGNDSELLLALVHCNDINIFQSDIELNPTMDSVDLKESREKLFRIFFGISKNFFKVNKLKMINKGIYLIRCIYF